MSVGKYDKESEYIEKKKAEYNSKEPGRGDSWEKNWVRDRKANFEPKFIELFEKSSGMTVSADAKYTLIFFIQLLQNQDTIFMFPKRMQRLMQKLRSC